MTHRNEEEKKRMIASAHKLAFYFRISEDFSKKERDTIKEWHKEAKEKTATEKEECCVWKVRGSPRKRLYFKKICAKNEHVRTKKTTQEV